ncbi:uncharacterized protein LOC132311480 [Cornus florida]|uniref:uncharacterized protein LOC132311480 n=1 Tax=Cornus florida TaxID=4283 RepID=UPI00289DB26D|nr:uncharacterized protein LOC132311480 [Cornus florida]XP_059665371.1 uncharacterized protein LOC132311480 [Cornus florida]XP_059665372.1 uncharacterized protein LOC132311480 [Cornus florida]XP_059665373.1 uncharacterized protein LOC132311480 [Cornus florida]XP_059665374.1 uncharacterized protein LOC132311480 [Cornus florida]
MASKLIRKSAHEADNPIEVSLREAFQLLEPQLRPPFPLKIPTPQEYLDLNMAILYGILCEPHLAKIHIKHLHGKVTDGYTFFTNTLVKIVDELYPKLVEPAKVQLIWITSEMVYVSALGVDMLVVALLRQIVGGDFSEGNLWLCSVLLSVLLDKWDCLLEEEPLVLTSALYTFLRLLADHYRLPGNLKIEALKRMEINFCVRMLREQFHLCFKIGRDLIRLLQDLFYIPEFRAIWKDLMLNPGEFKTEGFLDISRLYRSRTSSRYFLLRITPEMETQLRFLLTNVKLGSQKRYQAWFATKFLCAPDRETVVIDIVRFICCAHHPTNEIIQSAIIPRWAVIGWLLKSCRKKYVESNVKLALLYDWLFFEERVDNIMNIEPAILLMLNSIPRYIDITHSLLEFLFLLVDNYDMERNELIVQCVSSAFSVLVRKGVVNSLDVFIACDALAPFLKERLVALISGTRPSVPKELQSAHIPVHSVQCLSLTCTSIVDSGTPLQEELLLSTCSSKDGMGTKCSDVSVLISNETASSCIPLDATTGSQDDALEELVQSLRETTKCSSTLGLQALEKILFLFVNLDCQRPASGLNLSSEVLSHKIAKEFELNGYKLFAPLECIRDGQNFDDEIQSATALIVRILIFSLHERVQDLLVCWSRNGFPVGARLLSYVTRLAYEAHVGGYLGNLGVESNSVEVSGSGIPLLTFHVGQYFCVLSNRGKESPEPGDSTSKMDNELVAKLVNGAFAAYRCFLAHMSRNLGKQSDDTSPARLMSSDLMACFEWDRKRLKFLLCSVFYYLSDLSIGEVDIMRLLVSQLNHADLLDMQFQIGLKKIFIFGESTETISLLIKSSFEWGSLEQHKFWGLIRSELAVSKVQVDKLILKFFCANDLDPDVNSIAVGGLMALCSCLTPTTELVGAIMFLPNNKFQYFAAAVLAKWAVSNASMLIESLADFLKKLNNGGSLLESERIMINNSALLWLLSYLDTKGMKGITTLRDLSVNIPDIKSMIGCCNSG